VLSIRNPGASRGATRRTRSAAVPPQWRADEPATLQAFPIRLTSPNRPGACPPESPLLSCQSPEHGYKSFLLPPDERPRWDERERMASGLQRGAPTEKLDSDADLVVFPGSPRIGIPSGILTRGCRSHLVRHGEILAYRGGP
jgi:hypothetical protein